MGNHGKKAPATGKKPRAPRRKPVPAASKGLLPDEVAKANQSTAKLVAAIASDGGEVIGQYSEPFGGHGVVVAALPIDKVEPTPFQRDRSEPHVKKLVNALERVQRFLDPLITVRKDGKYWTPNGNHRLGAMKALGMKSVVALVLPEEDVAYQILALNTEKAHNLKERSLEVIRMYRGLVGARGGDSEQSFAAIFEEPHFITFGATYEKRPRFSAGAYSPIVKRLEAFVDEPVEKALAMREARADKLIAFDDAVADVVAKLKAKGFDSPYLKNFIVARVNFLRFKPDAKFDFDETLEKVTASVRKIEPDKVSKDDVAKMGGGSADTDE